MKRLVKPGLLFWLVLPPLLWWALRMVPFDSVRQMLRQLNLNSLFGLLLLDAVIVLVFSSRGWLILRAFHRVNFLWLAAYRLSAFSISYFTPGQQFGGEPLQVYWLNRKQSPGRERHGRAGLPGLRQLSPLRLQS